LGRAEDGWPIHGAEHERQRRPRPLVGRRLPSGRGAMEQPNITSHGAGVLTPRFWALVAMTGIAAGLFGALMMLILFNVQYAAFGYQSPPGQAGPWRSRAIWRSGRRGP
jgi:chloride channel protein, CIC family